MPRPLGRLFDLASCPLRPIKQAPVVRPRAKRTFCNNKMASSVGDYIACDAVAVTGSRRTFIENRPAHRLGDLNSAAGTMIQYSRNVFVG